MTRLNQLGRALERVEATPDMIAHDAAIDRLCLNFMAGDFSLNGVAEARDEALKIERAVRGEDRASSIQGAAS